MAKLLEAVIKERIIKELDEGDAIAPNQHSFRKGRSTLTAVKEVEALTRGIQETWCILVTIDVKNAFNMASWKNIMEALAEAGVSAYLRRLVSNYFRARKILVDGRSVEITSGVPQGSVIGPTLWNVMYNDILRVPLPEGAQVVGYVDDVALTVRANSVADLNDTAAKG